MTVKYPHTIDNSLGEIIVFVSAEKEPDGEKLWVENFVEPGIGPEMHTHWMQEECLTVVKGKLTYQLQGHPIRNVNVGETVLFKRGIPHRFWNSGDEILHCKGWIKPANTIVFFLSAIFQAQKKSGSPKPEIFDAAYLMQRYASEYELTNIPWLVKKVFIPLIYSLGKWLNKYKHFDHAPAPL